MKFDQQKSKMAAPISIPNFPEFDCVCDSSTGTRWNKYRKRFENMITAINVTDPNRSLALLLHCGGERLHDIYETLSVTKEAAETDFTAALRCLNNYFQPQKNIEYETFLFHETHQEQSESLSAYHTRLVEMAKRCEFPNSDRTIKSHVIRTCKSSKLRREALEKNLSLTDILKRGRALELSDAQASLMEKPQVNAMSTKQSKTRGSAQQQHATNNNREHNRERRNPGNRPGNRQHQPSRKSCSFCGGQWHTELSKCPARGKTCDKCGKKNHFAKACLSNKNVHNVTNEQSETQHQQQDQQTNEHYGLYHLNGDVNIDPIFFDITVEGQKMTFELDTGSAFTIIGETQLKKHLDHLTLVSVNDPGIKTYGGDKLKILGEAEVEVQHNNQTLKLPVLVTPGDKQSLLGRNWLFVLKLDWTNAIKERAIHNMSGPKDVNPKLKTVLDKHKDVFKDEIGQINGVHASIRIDPQATPRFFKARPIPYALRERIEAELDRLQNEGIIRPVQFSEWASPIVPVVKTDQSIRICGDYKVTINKVSELDPYPIPRIEDIYSQLSGGERYTKVDLRNAYLQVPLDEESQKYVTINTTRGLYTYNRMPFGIKSGSAIFQRIMDTMFQGMRHVSVYQDDIIITGSTMQEHISNIDKVLTKLGSAGMRLKLHKCQFLKSSVTYLGHRIDAEGIHPTDDKVKAINEAPIPSTKKELQAYLGMLNYYGRYLPNISTVLAPLHHLLCKDVQWKWDEQQTTAFNKSKELLTSEKVLTHYDPSKDLVLACDASPYAVGCVLSHRFPDDSEKPIAYASRSMSAAERNYSQLDKEALAIIYGVKRFDQYLFGRSFTIITDHKPLLTLLSEMKAIPITASPRLVRWSLTLSAYDYNIVYRKGEDHGNADALSRLPLPETTSYSPAPGDIVNLLEQMDNTAVNTRTIRTATRHDPVLSKVYSYVMTGWPSETLQEHFKPFTSRKNELSVHEGCVLWGSRVVIPHKCEQQVLELLHDTHPGMTRMKSLARSYVWWPNLDADIENKVKHCDVCQRSRPLPAAQPLHPWEWPGKPWCRLHLDYLGPFQGKMILVIVDAHSKWLDAHVTSTSTSSTTIEKLRQVFATHGLPRMIVSDNGTCFTSAEFKKFVNENGIKHVFTAPYHPSSNGLAERAVRTVKHGLKRLTEGSLETRLSRLLLSYRTTPHATTGLTPSEMLMNRRLRTRITQLVPDTQESVIMKQAAMKDKHDKHSRERQFSVDDKVYVRLHDEKKWHIGEVISINGPLSYTVRLHDGRIFKRHVDHLKERFYDPPEVVQSDDLDFPRHGNFDCVPSANSETLPETLDPPSGESRSESIDPGPIVNTDDQPVELRRSTRIRKPVERLNLHLSCD